VTEPIDHDAFVAAWIERATAGRSSHQLVELLELALNALHKSARKMLGEVTLAAIIDRVLYNAAERLEQSRPPDEAATRDGLRFVIIELLTVLGNLTAEILTPALHKELSQLEEPAPQEQAETARVAREAKDKGP
jgi:hypothetical protein